MTAASHINLPCTAGTSFKPRHFGAISDDVANAATLPGFVEVHSENYFHNGTADHSQLARMADHFALSFHGVGMNLGNPDGLNRAYLAQLKRLIDRYNPAQVSDHIAWVGTSDHYLNDLLPLPYTEEAMDVLVRNIEQAQDFLGRQILVENPSTYLTFAHSTINEAEFVAQTAQCSGAGLLLDINNIVVNAANHDFDAADWLAHIPATLIGEIHLAGHTIKQVNGQELRIDDHGSAVSNQVWHLYADLIAAIGPRPTLIEWDTAIPGWHTLKSEAQKAAKILSAETVLGVAHA